MIGDKAGKYVDFIHNRESRGLVEVGWEWAESIKASIFEKIVYKRESWHNCINVGKSFVYLLTLCTCIFDSQMNHYGR